MRKIIGLIILIAIISCKSEKKEKEFIDSDINISYEKKEPTKKVNILRDSTELDSVQKTEKLQKSINSEN